jgi:hypothetical protein
MKAERLPETTNYLRSVRLLSAPTGAALGEAVVPIPSAEPTNADAALKSRTHVFARKR